MEGRELIRRIVIMLTIFATGYTEQCGPGCGTISTVDPAPWNVAGNLKITESCGIDLNDDVIEPGQLTLTINFDNEVLGVEQWEFREISSDNFTYTNYDTVGPVAGQTSITWSFKVLYRGSITFTPYLQFDPPPTGTCQVYYGKIPQTSENDTGHDHNLAASMAVHDPTNCTDGEVDCFPIKVGNGPPFGISGNFMVTQSCTLVIGGTSDHMAGQLQVSLHFKDQVINVKQWTLDPAPAEGGAWVFTNKKTAKVGSTMSWLFQVVYPTHADRPSGTCRLDYTNEHN